MTAELRALFVLINDYPWTSMAFAAFIFVVFEAALAIVVGFFHHDDKS